MEFIFAGMAGLVLVAGGLLLLIADIYAIVKTLQSSATDVMKIFWVLFILLMPFIGFIAWLLAGPRASNA